MQCGIACLAMICKYYGKEYSMDWLNQLCFATTEGVSLLNITRAAETLGLKTVGARCEVSNLVNKNLPCILHWNQNHFVVLYKLKKGKIFYIADPGKGLVKYKLEEFKEHWISTKQDGAEKGVSMFLKPTEKFYKRKDIDRKEERSFKFLFSYIKKYRKYFGQIILGLLMGSILQLILPFLTQSIVDVGIKNQNIGFIWLILLGQLMLTVSRTAIDIGKRLLYQALKAPYVVLRYKTNGRSYAANGRPQPCEYVSNTTNAQHRVLTLYLCSVQHRVTFLQLAHLYHLYVGQLALWRLACTLPQAQKGTRLRTL